MMVIWLHIHSLILILDFDSEGQTVEITNVQVELFIYDGKWKTPILWSVGVQGSSN